MKAMETTRQATAAASSMFSSCTSAARTAGATGNFVISGGANGTTNKISGLANGTLSSGSTEAVTGQQLFTTNNIRMRFDGNHAIAHNKVMIVDENIVITGSFNFTNSAQTRNAENLLVLRSADLAHNYKTNWLAHWKHSRD